MLTLTDKWVWDHWMVDTGSEYHIFYLQAPRSLGDPDLRHQHARTGHAVSTDLVRWEILPDALDAGAPGAWDDRATWTGSIVRKGDTWYCFYTGSCNAEKGLIQRVGLATSTDLITWERYGDRPLIEADARWYETLDLAKWHDQAWRDPWVFADPDGNGWHALITARAASGGPADGRGVVGHAWSPDLLTWEVRPPLSETGEFGHLEVNQVEIVNGQPVLIFCTGSGQISSVRRARLGPEPSATFAAPAASLLGPYDLERAMPVSELYAGRIVRMRDGRWALMGFINEPGGGPFVGSIGDPVPVDELHGFPGNAPGR
jgi:beta-fructofuranosidase